MQEVRLECQDILTMLAVSVRVELGVQALVQEVAEAITEAEVSERILFIVASYIC